MLSRAVDVGRLKISVKDLIELFTNANGMAPYVQSGVSLSHCFLPEIKPIPLTPAASRSRIANECIVFNLVYTALQAQSDVNRQQQTLVEQMQNRVVALQPPAKDLPMDGVDIQEDGLTAQTLELAASLLRTSGALDKLDKFFDVASVIAKVRTLATFADLRIPF
jgi:hypothetical protein